MKRLGNGIYETIGVFDTRKVTAETIERIRSPYDIWGGKFPEDAARVISECYLPDQQTAFEARMKRIERDPHLVVKRLYCGN